MARKVRQIRGKGNHIGLVPVPSMAAPDLDTRIALIQALIPVALESIHARVESRIAKVDHWKNSEQKQRWLATALLDLEPRLRRIKNFRALPLLRVAFTRQIEGMKKSAA